MVPGLVMPVSTVERALLSTEIEMVRKQMVMLGDQLGFLHPEVQQCSKRLDVLLVKYYEMDKILKND
jgi:hypothetical protein